MSFERIRFVGGPLADTSHVPDPRDQCLVASVPGHPHHRYVRTASGDGTATLTWHVEVAGLAGRSVHDACKCESRPNEYRGRGRDADWWLCFDCDRRVEKIDA